MVALGTYHTLKACLPKDHFFSECASAVSATLDPCRNGNQIAMMGTLILIEVMDKSFRGETPGKTVKFNIGITYGG